MFNWKSIEIREKVNLGNFVQLKRFKLSEMCVFFDRENNTFRRIIIYDFIINQSYFYIILSFFVIKLEFTEFSTKKIFINIFFINNKLLSSPKIIPGCENFTTHRNFQYSRYFFSFEKIKRMGESLWNNGGQIVWTKAHPGVCIKVISGLFMTLHYKSLTFWPK